MRARALFTAALAAGLVLTGAGTASAASELVVNDGPNGIYLIAPDGREQALADGSTSRYIMREVAAVRLPYAICGKKSVNYGPWVLSGTRFSIGDGDIVHVKTFLC